MMLPMTAIEQRSGVTADRHPVAMPAVVSIEMWERFSFYGMQAILAYYLYATISDGGLGMDKVEATALVGAYGSLLYLCAFGGGWVGDRLFGPERTLLLGAGLLMFGHLSLSLIPGWLGTAPGLIAIAVGSGLLKTAAITVLGRVYPSNGARHGVAFQLFYLGINVGAFFGPLLTGWLAARYSYHHGFGAAAVLMAVGLAIYLSLRPRMMASLNESARSAITTVPNPLFGPARFLMPLAVIAIAVALLAVGMRSFATLATVLLIATVSVAVALFIQMFRSPLVSTQERHRVAAFLPMFIASTTYWALLAQTYGVFAVYSAERLNRTFLGFDIPPAWTQSLNPLYILTLALPLAWVLARLRTRRGLHSATTMASGLLIAGAGMLVLLPFAGGAAGSTPFLALAGCILLFSLGELLIGPVGMAATSAHAPAAFATRFSALYFLTLAIGTSLAGSLSRFFDPSNAVAERTYLLSVTGTVVAIAVGVFIAARALRRNTEETAA